MQIVDATMAARKATGKMIATQVKQGKFIIVDLVTEPGKRRPKVIELTGWMSLSDTIAALWNMAAETDAAS